MIPRHLGRNRRRLAHDYLYAACVCVVMAGSGADAQSAPNGGPPKVDAGVARRDTAPPGKNRGDARFYGFLYPGGGQYYLGEYRHGAAITVQSLALLGAGTLALVVDNCTFHFSDQGLCVAHRHFGQWAIGSALLAAGAWVWARGAVEAGTRAPNSSRSASASSTVRPLIDVPRSGSVLLGLSIGAGP